MIAHPTTLPYGRAERFDGGKGRSCESNRDGGSRSH